MGVYAQACTAPPRWRPGSWTWTPTTSGSRAPHGWSPMASGRQLGGGHGVRGGCGGFRRRPTTTSSPRWCPACGMRWPGVRRIIGVMDAADVPQRDALLLDLDRELSQAGPIHDRDIERILDAADQEQSGEAEQP